MSDVTEAAFNFEAIKTSLSQSKSGMILRLAIHPEDMPQQLLTDWVGSRYQVVMVKLDDNDQPEVNEETVRGNRAIASAAMLCRNTAFYAFLMDMGRKPPQGDDWEGWAAGEVRHLLGIQSRSELKANMQARREFDKLKDQFEEWRVRNPHKTKTERRPIDGE